TPRKRLGSGPKEQFAPGPAVVEGLLAEPVADQAKGSLLAVPQAERKHADAALERLAEPPGGNRLEQGLRVAMAAPAAFGRVARSLDLGAQLAMVVDLAVEAEDIAA